MRSVTDAAMEKIRRIRGDAGPISPAWQLPPEAPHISETDPLLRKIGIAAAACFALAVILFFTYKVILGSGISSLSALAGRL